MAENNITLSTTKLFVGGLDRKMRGSELRDVFSRFGDIAFARVKLEEETNRSKGYGFVVFINPADAAKAQKAMDGQEIMWRTITVDFAKENTNTIVSGASDSSETRTYNKGQSIQQAMGL